LLSFLGNIGTAHSIFTCPEGVRAKFLIPGSPEPGERKAVTGFTTNPNVTRRPSAPLALVHPTPPVQAGRQGRGFVAHGFRAGEIRRDGVGFRTLVRLGLLLPPLFISHALFFLVRAPTPTVPSAPSTRRRRSLLRFSPQPQPSDPFFMFPQPTTGRASHWTAEVEKALVYQRAVDRREENRRANAHRRTEHYCCSTT
jgi:hypothetical protein